MTKSTVSSLGDENSLFLYQLAMERCRLCLAHMRAIIHQLFLPPGDCADGGLPEEQLLEMIAALDRELASGARLIEAGSQRGS